ncbi:hypothetical protein GGI11_008686, partial [Coemansia sp. RSA 2049]
MSIQHSQQQQQQQHERQCQRSLEFGRCTQTSDTPQVSGNINIRRRKSNVLITSSDLMRPSWSAVPDTLATIFAAAAETRSNSITGGPQRYPGSASAPLPQSAQQSAADIPTPGLVRRGTKRRGSDTCIVLLAVDSSSSSSSRTLDDTRSHSPASLSHAAFPCAKRVYRARSTLSSRKSRKMIGTNGSSPSLFAEFGSASVSAPAST